MYNLYKDISHKFNRWKILGIILEEVDIKIIKTEIIIKMKMALRWLVTWRMVLILLETISAEIIIMRQN